MLTGTLRSTDVVAKNAYARRLLRDFERRRFEAGAARLLPLPAGSGGAEAEAAPAAAEATAGWWAAGSSWVRIPRRDDGAAWHSVSACAAWGR